MITQTKIQYGVIAVLVIVIFLMRACGGKGTVRYKDCPPATTQIVKYHRPGDTVQVTVYRNHPVAVFTHVTDTFTAQVDTAHIIADYLLTRGYSTVTRNDTSYEVTVNDTVQGNKLIGQSIAVKNLRCEEVTATINTYDTCPKPHLKVAIGAELGGNKDYFAAGLRLMFITKKEVVITGGCDYDGRFIPRIGGYWIIRLRK